MQQVDTLVTDYLAGATVGAVAQKYKININTATRHLNKRGIQIRQQKIGVPDEDLENAKALRDAGWTLKAIGEKYGCTRVAVTNAFTRLESHRRSN